jgi:hypothetical protein
MLIPMRFLRFDILTGFAFAVVLVALVAGCKSTHVGADALGGATGSGGAPGGNTGSGGSTGAGGMVGNDGAAGSTGGDPCATALYCDDFEKYAANAAPTTPWHASTNMGAVTVDGTMAHSGSQSIKMTTQARTTDGIKTAFIELAGNNVFPVAGNVFYGRMMFYLDAAPTTSVHWTLIQGAGVVPSASDATYHALYRYGGQLPVMQGSTFVGSQLMANYDTPDSYPIGSGTPPASDCWQHADKVVVPVGRWACVEWKFDGPNNRMNLWLDGAAVSSLTMNGTGQGCVNQPATPPFVWTAPNFDRLDLGWESYQTDGVRTIHVDDVVISKTQIGCP